MENNGGNARNGMGIQVRGISMGMRGIWEEMPKMWGIRIAMQKIKVGTYVWW